MTWRNDMTKLQKSALIASLFLNVVLALGLVGTNAWHAYDHYRSFVSCTNLLRDGGLCDKIIPRS